MRTLVVGGAGYIGSHAVRALLRAGHEVTVFDDLSLGHRAAVPEPVAFVEGDILSPADLDRVFSGERFDAVLHFAAKASVPESVAEPESYYRVNVEGSLMLFSAARRAGVGGVVFSSSAATYGMPEGVPIREDAPTRPINPYGRTKRMMEEMLADFARAYGLPSVSLRYFNAAGAEPVDDPADAIGEDHDPETHLIPRVLFAARDGASVPLYGTDYDTPDGTAIRDYIHVTDLAEAHVLAVGAFEEGKAKVYNLGTGTGASVREVIEAARRVTGREIAVEESPRRPGDPPRLVASSERFASDLGWRPRLGSLDRIVETAWRWHVEHPHGYDG
jgi:UDP-glucose-4-epimerase GalE